MSEIKVDTKKLREQVDLFDSIHQSLKSVKNDINASICSITIKNMSYLIPNLVKIKQCIYQEELSVLNLKNCLGNIANVYLDTEKVLYNQDLDTIFESNPAFDSEGAYGGNQSSPVNRKYEKFNEFQAIVRKYYPKYTDKQIEKYLEKMESEGCGYVALINTLFNQYVGKEDIFQKKFGFAMYDESGDLNYDALLLDFYSATDNHVQKKFLFWEWDGINYFEDGINGKGYGTTTDSRKYRWELYLHEHNVDVVVNNIDLTMESYREVSSRGSIVVGIYPCILYDKSGNEVKNIDGGHAMTVTGITEDGMYKVSSWGEEYYIKPNDTRYQRMQFQQICY